MKKIGELFIENKVLTQKELDSALTIQKSLDVKRPLGEILVDLGLITYDKLINYIEIQLKALEDSIR